MVTKISIAFGFGVILLSSILAPAAAAGAGANPPTASVYFSLAGGTYNTPQLLTLTDSTPGAVIYYSTTGQPTLSSPTYSSPIVIKSTETVTAVAIAPGYAWSAESAKSYKYVPFPMAAAPHFNLAGGTYTTPQTLTLTSTTPNASFCYTIDGTSPLDANGALSHTCLHYSGPIAISQSELVEAVTTAPSYNVSNASAKQYVFPGVGGDSLLGLLEGAISFCGTISAGSPAGYRQMDLLYTSGQTSRDLQKVRGSNDYKSAYSQTQQQLQGLSNPNAVSVCNSN